MPPKKIEYRTETDQHGQQAVPMHVYWGAQTARALASGVKMPEFNPRFLEALLLFQKAVMLSNTEQGRLDNTVGRTAGQAVDEVIAGQWQDQFVITTLQPGAVYEIIANLQEVLANRAGEILGSAPGSYSHVLPQRDFAAGRNVYEDFAASVQIALLLLQKELEQVLRDLERLLRRKALEFDRAAKNGSSGGSDRDGNAAAAARMFNGYGADVAKICRRIFESSNCLLDLHLRKIEPNTLNQLVIDKLCAYTGLSLRLSEDSSSRQTMSDLLEFSSSLRLLAVSLNNMTQDLRSLKSTQQTTIEFVSMVCHQVIGLDAASCALAQTGQMESSTMLGLASHNLLYSIELLKQTLLIFNQNCVAGFSTNAAFAACN